ncbi:nitroreductase family protein [Clostridium akagii]|uniref:nitroreductase family protein n=1 Tax=Clostridium akagii TaxID=91623 RepID=UPI000479B8C5|nr:nitroreductase family protein [Clostridium akagii]
MNFIQVDKEKCTQCGLCVNVCRGALGIGTYGPEVIKQQCISCGHCVAACPNGALDNLNSPLKNQVLLKKNLNLNADSAAQFLRSRRSIRSYKKIAVPREKISKLLDIARFAPSACNLQGVSYHVIDNPNTLKKITEITIEWAEEKYKDDTSTLASSIKTQVDNYHKYGIDVVLRSAPCLIVAITDSSMMSIGRDDTHFALAYAQLYAPTIELGTCWAGFFENCATSCYQPLQRILNLPQNMSVTGGLMVGFPKYTFKRLVDRNPLQITWE